jgi:hypothetical protein
MEVIATLVSAWLPTRQADVSIEDDGDAITVAVEGVGNMRSDRLRDPEGTPFTLRGGGFVGGFGLEEADLAPTRADWSDEEMRRRFETKSGARGDFTWSG